MAASWPTSIPTDATLYIAVNELQTNLSSGINNSVTTIPLNSTTGFPTVGLVLIDNEIIKYTGVSGGNLTGATRGFDGTTAASHSSAAVVSFAICAQHHNVTKDEIIALATYLSNNLGTGAQPLANGSRALASSAGGKITESSVTSTELGYLSGVTSAIQTQLNAKAAASVAPTVQRFTSGSGTYTRPSNPTPLYLKVKMVGGGGGACGSGTAGGGTGGTGGATTFGATASAGPGTGGTFGSETGGAGGANTTAGVVLVNVPGMDGQPGGQPTSASQVWIGGMGGATAFGGAGAGANSGSAGKSAQANTGGGGGGGGLAQASGVVGCGGGAGGYMELLFTSPASSFAYAVGAGGNAGTAGTSGNAGGAGGSGVIIVEEYYQ